MELIDKETAYKELSEYYHHTAFIQHLALSEALDRVPTVDAQPVRHGRWVRDEFGTRCGACGLYAYRDKFDQPWESPYCPNCGAKMDGEQEKQEKEKAFWSRYLLKPCAEEEEEQNDQTD